MNPTTTETIQPATTERPVRLGIRRQDGPDKPPRWEEFAIPHRPNMNICPKEIPLLESIASVQRQETVHLIKKFFSR